MNEHEAWPWIPGYEGVYRISGGGVIWSSPRPTTPGGPLKWNMSDRYGYPRVTLVRDGVQKKFRVHKLVTLTFFGPTPHGMEILHINGDAGDPRVENLRFGTHAENGQDTVRHGTCASSRKTHCPRGHAYDDVNTLISGGRRYCRACGRIRSRSAA